MTAARRVDLSVIVISWNTRDILRACLQSLDKHLQAVVHEVIVVDNASADGSPDMVAREFPQVRLVRNQANLGFGAANNIGMAMAEGRFFLLLNSDAQLLDDSVVGLMETLRHRPDVGVIAPRLVFEDGRTQANARRFPALSRLALQELMLYRLLPRGRAGELLLGPYWSHEHERAVDWLVGACLLVRRDVFEQTGGFDARMFLYGEEVEWCRRIRDHGFVILFSPSGSVLHLDHKSTDQLLGAVGRMDRCLVAEDRLLARWDGRMAAWLAPLLRIVGALVRLTSFGARRLIHDDEYGRSVRGEARQVLGHYRRRWRGRLGGMPT